MSARSTYFRVGLFVLVASALGVGGIVIFGAGQIFKGKVLAETYVDESAVGLEVGSPVRYRGVQVGTVEGITFVFRRYPEMDATKHLHGRYVLIDLAFDDKGIGGIAQMDMPHLVEDGLRIRIASSGITGVAYLEIDFLDKDDPANKPLDLEFTPMTHYIPSAKSTIARFTSAIEKIIDQIENAHVDRIATDVRDLLTTVKTTIDTDFRPILGNLERTTAEFPETVRAARGTVEKLEKIIADVDAAYRRDVEPAMTDVRRATAELEPFARSLNETLAELKPAIEEIRAGVREVPPTLEQAQRSIRNVDRIAGAQRRDVDEILSNLRLVTNDLKDLTATMRRFPAHALFGEPPPRREDDER